jgi:hypothetical protein
MNVVSKRPRSCSPRKHLLDHNRKLKRPRGEDTIKNAGIKVKQTFWTEIETFALFEVAKTKRSFHNFKSIHEDYQALLAGQSIIKLRTRTIWSVKCKLDDLEKKKHIYNKK